ncbi:MAG: sugar phosphate isomerase/epimerase family protein [Cyclobacteriaceae bacterium]
MQQSRRVFVKNLTKAGLAAGIIPAFAFKTSPNMFFDISLAQWSLNKSLFGGQLTNLDFPVKAKNDYGITAVEYVNQFFMDKASDMNYLKELKKRSDDHGVKNVLIMIDREGQLANTDEAERKKAVENHYKWVDAAKFLGCHSIRVNAAGNGCRQDVLQTAVDGLGKLTEYGKQEGINIIVENHGGFSSDGKWLSEVIKQVNSPYCGTLPDFGNFRIRENVTYDRYAGVKDLMPFAKGVSAKSHEFDAEGNEIHTNYGKMLQIVKDAGYRGYIGIEYEGKKLSEDEGIMATKRLLEKIGSRLS